MLVATCISIATECMFKKHFYSFDGEVYQQMGGGPTGLRSKCALARLVMQIFDGKWEDVL